MAVCVFGTQAWEERNKTFASQSSFDAAIEAHFYVLRADRNGSFVGANAKYLARIGYSLEELGKQPLGGLSAEQGDSAYLSQMWSTVQSGQIWTGEFCDMAKDGSRVWISALVIPSRDPAGDISYLTTIGVDVSDLRKAKEDLDAANARLQAFIKHAPTAVAMFDRQMNYVAHTDRWLSDYKLPYGSLVGRNHYEIFPEIPDHWRRKHQRILAGATEWCEEEKFRRSDGTENIIRWEVRPWYLADNTIGGMMMLTEEISERIKLKDRLWRLAKLDALTSLPNRLSFNELLHNEIQFAGPSERKFAVALLDVDRLKEINDTLGHDIGDQVLQELATRLADALADFGTIARLGGDEFAILIRGSDSEILEHFKAVESAFSTPVLSGSAQRHCTASIGVTKFPDDATEASDLLKNADLALYRAKSDGRGRTVFFKPELRKSMRRKVELQQEAANGIRDGKFLLYFQPIVPADPTLPISFEALLRWRHPTQGILSPGQFEEIFEDAKLAALIGDGVVAMAVSQAKTWLAVGQNFGRIAVNVTSADFAFGCLASRLQETLDQHNVPASKLCIEVTEKVFLGPGSAYVGEALQRITNMGVEIALDDFGTGYASLTHLKAFPIGRLKIDRSFVQDMLDNKESLSIVKAIVQLGNSLGIGITAEGVENRDQLELLRYIGCSSFQGYLFSPPCHPKKIRFSDFLDRSSRSRWTALQAEMQEVRTRSPG